MTTFSTCAAFLSLVPSLIVLSPFDMIIYIYLARPGIRTTLLKWIIWSNCALIFWHVDDLQVVVLHAVHVGGAILESQAP